MARTLKYRRRLFHDPGIHVGMIVRDLRKGGFKVLGVSNTSKHWVVTVEE